MSSQLFSILQLDTYPPISDLPERPAGRSFCKQKTPQLFPAEGFAACYLPKKKVGGSIMECLANPVASPLFIVALFWTVRNMEK